MPALFVTQLIRTKPKTMMQAQTMIDLTVEFTRIPLLTVLEKKSNGSPASSASPLDAGTFHKVTGRTVSLNDRHNYSAALEEQLLQLYSPGRKSCSKYGDESRAYPEG